jgi:pimeloyl-ACP methyl ester carboxylesterase
MAAQEEFDLTLRSGRLRARRWGSRTGTLVLGVPGPTGNVENFAFLGERLGGDTLQLVALDLRGRGRSDVTPRGTYGWERHALDVLDVADALGLERFGIIGQSMGGSVAIKAAELAGPRLAAVVLVDVAGRVDPGVAAPIAASIGRLGRTYASVDHYLEHVRSLGLVDPWDDYWDRAYRYELCEVAGGVRPRTDLDAVHEDRAYTATQDPHHRWRHLAMPTLLLRATQEIRPGAGFVVPPSERDRFVRDPGTHGHTHRWPIARSSSMAIVSGSSTVFAASDPSNLATSTKSKARYIARAVVMNRRVSSLTVA